MLCPVNNVTYLGEFIENGIIHCGPDEWSALGIIGVDERGDLGDEVFRADEGDAADLALGDECKPALDLIKPGRIGRREVDVETPPRREPCADLGMFVRGVIVYDEMSIELLGPVGIDMLEKAQEFLMPMRRLALREHTAFGDIECRKQCRSPMSDVTVGDAYDVTEPKRQNRLGTFECLDLALLVDAEHDRMNRWIEIKSDNVSNLVEEQRIGGKLEVLGAMRLDAEQRQHTSHRASRQACSFGSRAHRPMRSCGRLLFENGAQKFGNRFLVMRSGAARSCLAVKSRYPLYRQ